MEVLSITIGGFRNLGRTELRLDEKITALISTNNYGKSNLLDAVSFGVRFINSTPQMRLRMMGDESCIPLTPKLDMDDYVFRFELRDPSLGEYQYMRYEFSFAWKRDDGTGAQITGEKIELNSKRGGIWSSYLKRDEGKYRPSHATQRCTRKVNLDQGQLAIDVLTAFDDIAIYPAIQAIRSFKYGACYPLSADDVMHDYPLEITDAESGVFALSENDLPHALFALRSASPQKYEAFQSIVCELFAEIVNIEVVSSRLLPEQKRQIEDQTQQFQDDTISDEDGFVPYRIRDEVYRIYITNRNLNQPVSIARMSDGTKRVIWLIARAVMAESAEIVCLGVEEIETGIHPRMMRNLVEALDEVLGSTKIVLTSHSPHLVQCLSFRSIYVGVPNDEGVALFSPLAESALDDLADGAYDRGMSAGEYIFFLMSSGCEEEDELRRHLEVCR